MGMTIQLLSVFCAEILFMETLQIFWDTVTLTALIYFFSPLIVKGYAFIKAKTPHLERA